MWQQQKIKAQRCVLHNVTHGDVHLMWGAHVTTCAWLCAQVRRMQRCMLQSASNCMAQVARKEAPSKCTLKHTIDDSMF
jgi:hypothetical protein